MKLKEKYVFAKNSDLIYDVVWTKIIEETYFSFYFTVSTIEYDLKRCCIMMQISDELDFFFGNSDAINTILWIWLNLHKTSLIENFIFCVLGFFLTSFLFHIPT